ncbi:LolA family protein [Aurantiacibacter sp. MUD61]|uniref:LolA family protein n=1 Tax=Aurantiacibacter sp. MUD61 TaxID=3009083 RepID=UPI0022EFECB3|nr:outer membrane lipoprotein carrier protein LolA [Aurantiacibacter sp. MUD61]
MNAKTLFSKKPLAAVMAGAMAVTLPASLALPVATATAQPQANDLSRATRALRAITTLQADFTQTDRAGNTVSGELTLRNPGRIRFEYEESVNMLVVSDGRALTLVDYDVQQVERWPIRNSPLGALLDPNRDMTRYGTVQPTDTDNVISINVRDPERPEFGSMTLIFVEDASAPGGLELASWVALDSQNTRTTVRLRNHRYGASVPDSTFRYRDPRRSSRRPG